VSKQIALQRETDLIYQNSYWKSGAFTISTDGHYNNKLLEVILQN